MRDHTSTYIYIYIQQRSKAANPPPRQNENRESEKSRSGGSKIEVQRVQNRVLEGFLAALGAAGRSWDHPEGVVVRLGGVLEPSWRRFGCVLDGLEAVFGASWGRLGST